MNLKYYRTGPLITLILLLAAGLDILLEGWIAPFLQSHEIGFVRAPGNASIIAAFLILYDKVLWKYPVLNLLVKTPHMAGRYEGFISYERNDKLERKSCVAEVVQTASRIKMCFYFNNDQDQKTGSRSLVEEICQEDDGNFGVYMFYMNEGSKKDGVLDCHEGANKLRFLPGKRKQKPTLIGHYFTNRNKQTRGEMEVDFVTKNIKGKF